MWVPPNGRHVAIGALIGFGLGAAPGAHAKTDQHLRAGIGAIFAFGGIGALLGAVVGAGVLPMHARNPRRRCPGQKRTISVPPRLRVPVTGPGPSRIRPSLSRRLRMILPRPHPKRGEPQFSSRREPPACLPHRIEEAHFGKVTVGD